MPVDRMPVQPVRQRLGAGGATAAVEIGHEHRELVATETRHHIAFADDGLQDRGHRLQEAVAGGADTTPGIGKNSCRERPVRMVRNPATGETIKKDADKQVKVTVAKALKDSVNG